MIKRKPESHKGDYGHLLILGGSPGLTGAVCLSAISALRSGCGLVTVGIPESLNPIIEVKLTEAMSLPLPETESHTFSLKGFEKVINFIEEKADGVVIGPGISLENETSKFVKEIVKNVEKPILIDADGLKIISSELKILKNKKIKPVLTPHPGEMRALTGKDINYIQKNREKCAEEFAKEYGVVMVLKGHHTVVSDGEKIYINLTGNPGMATAGSGDVLSGIIGSLLVQKMEPFDAAKTGVYIHGLAGDFALKEKGEISLIASDIIEYIPHSFLYFTKIKKCIKISKNRGDK
ncbi:MAG TPA: NAD(P)H-hydrate dehydratase [Firmicutes bacterium]|nr:MAG: NAD(P)H-hydrate dehydratase [Candidatus Omnitrophota bacterium]HDD64883.1 NAD(P)H-hydrate dehydratase [Bacillota bacterium]